MTMIQRSAVQNTLSISTASTALYCLYCKAAKFCTESQFPIQKQWLPLKTLLTFDLCVFSIPNTVGPHCIIALHHWPSMHGSQFHGLLGGWDYGLKHMRSLMQKIKSPYIAQVLLDSAACPRKTEKEKWKTEKKDMVKKKKISLLKKSCETKLMVSLNPGHALSIHYTLGCICTRY